MSAPTPESNVQAFLKGMFPEEQEFIVNMGTLSHKVVAAGEAGDGVELTAGEVQALNEYMQAAIHNFLHQIGIG